MHGIREVSDINRCRHVSSLLKNLISIEMLDSKDCSFAANGGILKVSKENKEMLQGKKARGLYRLEGSVQTMIYCQTWVQ